MRKNILSIVLVLLLLSLFLPGSFIVDSDADDGTVQSQRPNSEEISQSATAGADDTWPMLAANPQRTSWTSEEVKGSLNVAWYKPIEPYIPYKVQPIAANNKIYVSTARGLYTFSADNGSLLWVYPTEVPLGHSPTIATVNGKSIAFVGGYDRVIHAIDANTGQSIAGYTPYVAGAGFETNPLVINNVIYAGNRDGYFYALNAITGVLVWRYETGDAIQYSAAYKDGVVYFASNDAYAYALNAGNGSPVWISDKLPGAGFHSFWPVVYTHPATGKDYVVFSSGENYRFRPMNLVNDETDTIYVANGIVNSNQLIGSTSTSIPGDWVENTTVIDAHILTNYFEDQPGRRTIFVLDGDTGDEFTFDSDNDGKMEYAPFNWSGVTHSGAKYPPIVNGIDHVYYQAAGYKRDNNNPPWISRSAPVGWKFGTKYISRVSDSDFASDEPLAYSSGGNVIYYTLCCDRAAGSIDISKPYGQSNRAWTFYNYNLASNSLMPGYQQMYNSGNANDYGNVNGWQLYSGKNQSKNGVYGKHGSTQSPPIPYQGKVYTLKGNSLIAFSPTGTNPKTPLSVATTQSTQNNLPQPDASVIAQRLEAEVQEMLAAGPLRPGYYDSGFTDLYGMGSYSSESSFVPSYGKIFDYFQHPADTVYTLLLAYPHLSTSTQQQVKTYLQNYYGPGKTYDFTQYAHVGWATGATREHLIIPEDIWATWYPPYNPSADNDYPPFYFYAAWQYAKIVGNNDQAFARDLFNRINNDLNAPLSDYWFTQKPYWLNQYIAGYMGYLELQKLAGYSQSQSVLSSYQHMRSLRVSSFSKDTPYLPIGDESTGSEWQLSYNNTLAVARNFMFLTPELGDYLSQTLYSQIETAVAEYESVAPYWFVPQFDNSYGEGTFQHLYDSPALFQAKAYILKQPYAELVQWIDAPAFYRGDLFYIQNLAALLSEGGYTPQAQFSVSVSASTMSIDPGGSAQYTINIQPSGGFSQTITFSANSVPSSTDFGFNFDPASFTYPYGSTSATLTVNHTGSGSGLPGEFYTINVNASGGDFTAPTKSFGLLVGGTKTYLPLILKNN